MNSLRQLEAQVRNVGEADAQIGRPPLDGTMERLLTGACISTGRTTPPLSGLAGTG